MSYHDYDWREGEIAFLKSHEEFSNKDYEDLIISGQVHKGATNHPVIILKRHSPSATHVLVTSVSAYGSGPDNDFLPPWKQPRHRHKAADDFRAFLGSASPTRERPHFLLEAGSMPKPQASWVYVQRVYLVPVSTLKFFNKANRILCMEQDSLADLRQHILKRNRRVSHLLADPRLRLQSGHPTDSGCCSVVSPRQQTWGFVSRNSNPRLAPSTTTSETESSSSSTQTVSSASAASSATSPPSGSKATPPRSMPKVPARNTPAPEASKLVDAPKPVTWAVACA
ncbi:hypothetical protein SLS62_007313 [Diatrype stigma]|uniref:Uncharacterized protein n=1 Tax=Diatrype stigma TaxID=117547 RepID=A0AAN9UMX7_9PEZI